MRISDWSSDVCSSDLVDDGRGQTKWPITEHSQQSRRQMALVDLQHGDLRIAIGCFARPGFGKRLIAGPLRMDAERVESIGLWQQAMAATIECGRRSLDLDPGIEIELQQRFGHAPQQRNVQCTLRDRLRGMAGALGEAQCAWCAVMRERGA